MGAEDSITLGLSPKRHATLKRLKEEGVFLEMRDGYRFAVALALARESIAPEGTKFETIFNIGSLDPDGTIRDLVSQLRPEAALKPHESIQRLAEWGIGELETLMETGEIRFRDIFRSLGD